MAYKNKEKERQNKREYYQKNKAKILLDKRKYYQKNKTKIQEKMRLYNKKWYQKNKKKIQLQHRKWCRKNKAKRKQYLKGWYQKNKKRILQQSKKYYQKNRVKKLQQNKEWHQKNKKRFLEYKRKWGKYQRETSPRYRLDENMGSAIARALKDKKAGQKWEDLVNYTLEDLMKHLEKQFDNKMNWDNYGSYWVIDHIKPKSLFNYTFPNDLEFKQCWALKNLQPLEKIKNLKKHKYCID